MRGKSCSMDGLGEQPDSYTGSGFYVPGERHENLPAGGFAGTSRRAFGTPVQSLWADTRAPEYATGGSGMFQGADFGSGNVISMRRRRGMGQDDSDDSSGISSLFSTINNVASTVTDVADTISPGDASSPAAKAAAKAAVPSIFSSKIGGVPVVAVLALLGAGAYFYMSKKKRS